MSKKCNNTWYIETFQTFELGQFCAATRVAIWKLGVLESVLKLLHISKIFPVGLLEEVKEGEKERLNSEYRFKCCFPY